MAIGSVVHGEQEREFDITPKYVPAAGEDVCAIDAHVLEIHLINGSGSSVTVTINDKQGTPMPIIPPALTITAGADQVWEFTGRFAPGGIHWSCSADNAVTGYIRWK